MRSKDTAIMEAIKEHAEAFYQEYGRSPSTAELGRIVGLAKSTIYKYLVAMDQNGILRYENGTIITELERSTSPLSSPVPIYNESVSCGPLEDAEATVQSYTQLPTAIFGNDDLYVLRTHGDSMINAGIEDGDFVVIKNKKRANVGDIVVARTEFGNTLKRLAYDKAGDKFYLHPENDTLDDIEVNELQIQGIAAYVIKKL